MKRVFAVSLLKRMVVSFFAASAIVGLVFAAGAADAASSFGVRIDLFTGSAVHILKAGHEDQLALLLDNPTDQRRRFALDVTLENFNREKFPVPRQSFDLAPRETTRWKLTAPAALGIWWVHTTLTHAGAGGSPVTGVHSFAYMHPAGPTSGARSGFRFGVAGWFASSANGPRYAEAIASCGIDIARFGGIWQAAEPREGQWNWNRPDEIVRQLREQQVEPQLMLSYCPSWAALPIPEAMQKRIAAGELRAPRGDHNRAPRLDAWRRFVVEAGRRYRGQVRYWEVWNEPDWGFYYGTTAHYLEMLEIAHTELKRIDPDNRVITGGFAVAATIAPDAPRQPFLQLSKRPNPDMQDVVLRDGQAYFDLHGHHEHGPFDKFARQIDEVVLPMRARYLKTPKPLYFTETGAAITHTGKDGDGTVNSEQEQAATLIKKMVFGWARGAEAFNWWCIVDSAEADYGLFTKAFQPKASFVSYNTLVTLLRGSTFAQQTGVPEKTWAFAFRGEKAITLVAWARRSAGANTTLTIETDAARAELVDLMGNRAPLAIANGRARVPRSTTPAFIVLHGATRAPRVLEP